MKEALAKEVSKKGADNPIALLKYVSNMQEFFLDKLGKPRDASVEVSNLGVWRPRNTPDVHEMAEPGKAKWTLGRMTFSQSMNHTSAQISVNAVTGGDGCMVINFCWPEEILQFTENCGIVHRIVKQLESRIKYLANSQQDNTQTM
jgi:hypothetical protein